MTDKEKSAIEIVRETSITIMKNGRKITLNNRELLAVFAKLVECGDISVIFHPPHCTTMLHHDDDDEEPVEMAGVCFKPGVLVPWDDDQQDSASGITMVCDQDSGVGEVVSFVSLKKEEEESADEE